MDAQAGAIPRSGQGRFLGESRDYFRLLSRDGFQLIATVGLYRFWVASDIRRFLWSNTEIAGDELEYTGDPRELLIGFLLLLVIICPLFAAASLLALASGAFELVGGINLLALVCLVPLAVLSLYQARRYRLSHTIFRGLRFRQAGSAWIYAIRTLAWFIVNLLTLGLTYPLARKSLERYKMRHVFYGDLRGDFQGGAGRLFRVGFFMWLFVLGPTFLILGKSPSDPSTSEAWTVLVFALGWMTLAALAVYPGFHATVLRWRIDGMRLGAMTFTSPFSTWSLYKAYFRFLGLMVLLAIAIGLVVAAWQLAVAPKLPEQPSRLLQLAGAILLMTGYFVVATVIAFAYQATVRLTLWRLTVNSLSVTGLEELDRAKALPWTARRHEGWIGGALNIGGF